MSANPDGSDEKVLLITPSTAGAYFVAWSPDGKRIACNLRQPDDYMGGIDMFDLASGKMTPYARFRDKQAFDLAWLPDGSGLLLIYSHSLFPETRAQAQIGFISYPAANFRTVTNDTNWYQTLTISADGKSVATVQAQTVGEVDTLPAKGGEKAMTVANLPQRQVLTGFDWMPNGELLVAEGDRMVSMGADGTNPITLQTSDSASFVFPSACANGQYFIEVRVAQSGTQGVHVWRADANGSNPRQLSEGRVDLYPKCSPDGKWAYYEDQSDLRIMRVPVSGGMPEEVPGASVTNSIFAGFALSPDGRTLAFIPSISNPATMSDTSKLALVDLAAGGKLPPRLLEVDVRNTSFPLQFTPDGKAVAYAIDEQGADNLWTQPLDGGKGRQITNFTSKQIGQFAWSSDGKRLAILRGQSSADVILLRETAQ